MNNSNTKLFTSFGILIPLLFWCSTIIGGMIHENYNHFRDTISELGAIGTKSENFMCVSTWLCTLLGIPFLIGLNSVCNKNKISKIPLIGVLGFVITFGWAATFHSGNPLHSKSGPVLLLLLAGPLLLSIIWKAKELKTVRIYSLTSLVLMLLILVRIIPLDEIQMNYTGLIQRFGLVCVVCSNFGKFFKDNERLT